MKHLQLTPPLLLITMGYPGSGKTFFARQFADLHGLPRVSEDNLRYELFERPLFNEDETEILQRIMHYSLEQLMQTERTVICEGSFLKTEQRKNLYEIAAKNGYRTLVVWLQTDLETAASRARNRDRRNPDSKYSFPIDAETFKEIRSQLERPGEKEQVVVISGKHAFKGQCLTVLRKIASMYSESLSKGDFSTENPLGTARRPSPNRRPISRFIQ
ncbi:MAG: ATP-binding protein [Candidatus Saccharimonadales bacterium]